MVNIITSQLTNMYKHRISRSKSKQRLVLLISLEVKPNQILLVRDEVGTCHSVSYDTVRIDQDTKVIDSHLSCSLLAWYSAKAARSS
jgi:hypothetical protein